MDCTRYKKATCNTKSNWRVFFNFLMLRHARMTASFGATLFWAPIFGKFWREQEWFYPEPAKRPAAMLSRRDAFALGSESLSQPTLAAPSFCGLGRLELRRESETPAVREATGKFFNRRRKNTSAVGLLLRLFSGNQTWQWEIPDEKQMIFPC